MKSVTINGKEYYRKEEVDIVIDKLRIEIFEKTSAIRHLNAGKNQLKVVKDKDGK
jgi:hypothetical protein